MISKCFLRSVFTFSLLGRLEISIKIDKTINIPCTYMIDIPKISKTSDVIVSYSFYYDYYDYYYIIHSNMLTK